MARKAEKTVLVKRGAMGAGIAAGINFLIFFISKGVGISYTVPPRMTDQEPIDLTATGIILYLFLRVAKCRSLHYGYFA